MICERCHGTGKIARYVPGDGEVIAGKACEVVPCPECNGSGLQHCCEGLCEQPEKESDDA